VVGVYRPPPKSKGSWLIAMNFWRHNLQMVGTWDGRMQKITPFIILNISDILIFSWCCFMEVCICSFTSVRTVKLIIE
jgi:hypothetical protein